jgi:hypothetical protein
LEVFLSLNTYEIKKNNFFSKIFCGKEKKLLSLCPALNETKYKAKMGQVGRGDRLK